MAHCIVPEAEAILDTEFPGELSRINLPLSLYTEIYWNIDLHNLFHFLELRLGAHAQKEIRLYTQTLLEITKKVVPQGDKGRKRYETRYSFLPFVDFVAFAVKNSSYFLI
ncbi:hypothetical protein AGMMS49940_09390 [Spirochaetia bacterium]|nr:hypothetical protein AGMMS49940_09390 [Spirochaetia bacterium]